MAFLPTGPPEISAKQGAVSRFLILAFLGALFFSQTFSIGFCAEQQMGSKQIIISTIMNEPTHYVVKHVLKEAYRRIGYKVDFNDLPGQRALEWANAGLTDGDAARIEGTEVKYPKLIRVKAPVIYFKGVAFAKKIDKQIQGWEDLRGLRIGVIRGIRYSTIGTEGMNPDFADDMTQLFTILDKDRIDVAVAVFEAGSIEISRHFKNSGIHVTGSELFSAPLYHFVNSRNINLADKLEAILKKMTASGDIQEIWTRSYDSLSNK